MSDLPFGFGQPDDDPERKPDDPQDPLAALFGGLGGLGGPGGPGGMPDLGTALQQIGKLLQWQGGPVNWDLARDMARRAAAGGGDPTVGEAERRAVDEALRLAEVWLDDATALPAATSKTAAWSRAEWVEATLPGWKALVEPVADRVVIAVGESMTRQVPAEMGPLAGQLTGMMRSVGGAMFGAQVGQALGSLATEVTSSTDVGLPLGPRGTAVLVPSGVSAFGEGLGVALGDVRLYLALREGAHHRLFGHAGWLRARIINAVEGYARGIHIDTDRIQSAMSAVDPQNPESVQQALTEGLFEPEDTPAQKLALARLETLLALVEGWVDEVAHTAAAAHLPSAGALRETVRRRRASGGPAEATFAALVGLELRPRRLREAATLWRAIADLRGLTGRDAVWDHPDLLPGTDDLDDPDGYARRSTDAGAESLDLSALEQEQPEQRPGAEPGDEATGDDGADR